jgi:hypothetical protein
MKSSGNEDGMSTKLEVRRNGAKARSDNDDDTILESLQFALLHVVVAAAVLVWLMFRARSVDWRVLSD